MKTKSDRSVSFQARDTAFEVAQLCRPRERLNLARELIAQVLELGIDYDEFESAQAVETYTKKAHSALKGLYLG